MTLTPENLTALAVDAGLLILLAWFIVLWLILREFRRFAMEVSGNKAMDSATYSLCQESVDKALNYTNDNSQTLNDLIEIQQALEAQVSQIKAENDRMLSEQDKETVDALTSKLSKSHQLITKLRTDLDRSVRGLRKAKSKLAKQHDTVESLRQEKAQIEKEFDQLEYEYIQISESGGAPDSFKQHLQEKEQLLATIDNYKKKLASVGDIDQLKQELANVKQQLKHITKEKDFVEKKYLDLINENGQ
ncbi:chromosome partitioning protein ParA [Vibrio caribbeanicus]|uniref:Chromosome partitioning protein ParA n=1 Tax=Vibrio caribbeanicus TaxID=701175 RepID=A0ACC4P2H6_9VIBR|nr:hypothetical protein [Vibrio caribbeanicus]KHD26764.1 chromosome partitioning protein ParA [Vibrio caribbeanicus]